MDGPGRSGEGGIIRIVFFGTGTFAVPALRVVAPYCVLAVSQPGKPSGRGLQVRPSPVEAEAHELGLTVATPEKARDPSFIESVRALEPDLLVVASYGQILRPALLEVARVGPINLHGSLLPRWRGAAPIARAIEAGDEETGITLMRMDEGMDTGPMIATIRTPIGPDETAGELTPRLANLAAQLLAEWLERLGTGEFPQQEQPATGITLAPKITREDARLDVRRTAAQEYDRYRAFTPAPGAFLQTAQGVLKITSARRAPDGGGEPGSLKLSENRVLLAFAEGALELLEVQLEGKPRRAAREWANGARIVSGDKLVVLE